MSKSKTYVGLLFDETGSMHSMKSRALDGVAEYIRGLQARPEGIRFTEVFFNSEKPFHIVVDSQKITKVSPPTEADYQPNYTTPLYDALGNMIMHMESKTESDDDKVIIVVMTDGEENASREFDQARINKLVTKRRKKGWGFVFLGTDIDSFAAGQKLGVAAGSTANFNSLNISAATRTAAEATLAYADGSKSGDNLFENVADGDTSGIYRSGDYYRDSKGRFASPPSK